MKAVVLETENYDAAESTVKSFRSEHEFVDGVCSLGGAPHTQSGITYEGSGMSRALQDITATIPRKYILWRNMKENQ